MSEEYLSSKDYKGYFVSLGGLRGRVVDELRIERNIKCRGKSAIGG